MTTPPRRARSASCASPRPSSRTWSYLEQLTSALYLDKRRDMDHYSAVMDQLCVQAERRVPTTEVLAGDPGPADLTGASGCGGTTAFPHAA